MVEDFILESLLKDCTFERFGVNAVEDTKRINKLKIIFMLSRFWVPSSTILD